MNYCLQEPHITNWARRGHLCIEILFGRASRIACRNMQLDAPVMVAKLLLRKHGYEENRCQGNNIDHRVRFRSWNAHDTDCIDRVVMSTVLIGPVCPYWYWDPNHEKHRERLWGYDRLGHARSIRMYTLRSHTKDEEKISATFRRRYTLLQIQHQPCCKMMANLFVSSCKTADTEFPRECIVIYRVLRKRDLYMCDHGCRMLPDTWWITTAMCSAEWYTHTSVHKGLSTL